MYYPEPLNKLITALGRLPGIGPKTAQRLAFHLLKVPASEARDLAAAILEARQKTIYCSICGNFTDRDPCRLCSDPERDHSCICVVEEARDIIALEKTRQYRGLYHVLQGAISPVDGIGPEQLRVKELLARLHDGKVKEVILATNADVEGESTALYLDKLLKTLGVKVTRLAYGLPVGGDLEYADEVTLARAFAGRHELE
ncbi:recombination protein RecR [Moorella thermoacetica]|uniref:Recombination protein RecR n=2 Tax=Neomoorella thermoacetica TaxID=1525 RepID=RECR_MOOTA|nr:recombination mediator RecR [Moorella thermoacetica]Q2RMH0.1 RecName: Full=Recombination protein RecR [Moorella thermoacetica ATCC 39073]AKX92858.1 recombination protein RecR [Moorella thermoacetica]AKX95411.1 recombination protein RecR [Moorella thermoacetica]AOQ22528.1 Recombination protein RecR [Moorella thermoacetica]OIQ10214.1 recombination protein RecR [Moorella thermoacetica]OIQ11895.1 recombination protein RecR [Moorella thermoacetica]